MAARRGSGDKNKVGFWEMVRDVAVAALNRGQFPLALVAAVMMLIIWRMPSEDVGKLGLQIFSDLRSGYLVGYVIAFLAIGGWFFHAKAQRRAISTEMRRLTVERNKLQESKIGAKLPSSEKE